MHCSFCGSTLHTITNCPKTWGGSMNRRHMKCSYCGSKKHNVDACPRTWGGNAKRAWREHEIEDDFVKD